MSRIFRRFASTAGNISAKEAAEEILQRYSDKPISVREQLIDGNQAQLLSLVFGRPRLQENGRLTPDGGPAEGTPLPAGYHFAYFTPRYLEKDLGNDGTDKVVNPLRPYTRRMWAGGTMEWKQFPAKLIRIGQTVTEITRLTSAEVKTNRAGDSLILAGLEKTFETDNGVALVDKRTWVFQKEFTEAKEPPPKPEEKAFPEGTYMRDHCQTDTTLFRMSAVTFNAHKIHVNKDWCRNVEGHRDLVVHGPIGLMNILDFYRDINERGSSETIIPKSISYRAQSPLYAGEKYRIILEKESDGGDGERPKWKAEIYDSFGRVAVKANIVE